MINTNDIKQISILLNEKEIIKYELLSNSFNINCMLYLSNNEWLIAKYYAKNRILTIISEADNLNYLKIKLKYFQK